MKAVVRFPVAIEQGTSRPIHSAQNGEGAVAGRVERRSLPSLRPTSPVIAAWLVQTNKRWPSGARTGTSSSSKIREHQGRVVRITGDGILAEFASVVNAVRGRPSAGHG